MEYSGGKTHDGTLKHNTVDGAVKPHDGLIVIRETNMEAILLENFYVDTQDDYSFFKDNKQMFACAIVYAIIGVDMMKNKPVDNREYHRNITVYKDNTIDKSNAEFMAMVLNYRKEDAVAIPTSKFNKYKGGFIFSIGAANVKCHKELKGQGRNETAQNILKHLIIGCK